MPERRWPEPSGRAALCLLAGLFVASAQAELDGAERAAVERLLEVYFERWSAADFDGYGALFHPTAVIHHVDDAGRTTRQALRGFLRGQRRAHARSPGRTEVPLSVDIEEQRPGFVRALVHWELREGSRRERGYDHFFLLRKDGSWRILSLVFHGE